MRKNLLVRWAFACKDRFWYRRALALAPLLIAVSTGSLCAQTKVTTLGGGNPNVIPKYLGFQDGNTLTNALFNAPAGLAFDPSGQYLLLADYNNDAIRLVSNPGNAAQSLTATLADSTNNGISHPLAVSMSAATNLYVLNYGNGTNGAILHLNGINFGFTLNYGFKASNAVPLVTNLTNATAMAMDLTTNLYATVKSNTVLRVTTAGSVTTLGIITNAGTYLRGIVVLDNGQLALSDAGNHGIWLMNPANTNLFNNAVKLTGFHGAADTNGPAVIAALNTPATLAKAGGNMLVVADYGNHKVKVIDQYGTITNLYGISSNLWFQGSPYPGWVDALAGPANPGYAQGYAEARQPYGTAVASDGTVYTTEDYYHILRHVTATGLAAPSGSSNSTNGIVTTNYPPAFNYPQGISLDPAANNLYVADPTNSTVWRVTFPNTTTPFLTTNDGLTNPISVLVDPVKIDPAIPDYYYVYVLSQNAATNGSILQFDTDGNAYGPLTSGLNQPTAFTRDGNGNLFVAEQSGAIKVVFPATGIANTIVTIATNANVQLQGIAILDNGNLAVSDAGNQVIWTVNPLTKAYSRLTGQIGISGANVGTINFAKLNQPHQLARSGAQLLVADSGNNRLVFVTPSGTTTTNGLTPSTASLWFGNPNDPVTGTNATAYPMAYPSGLAVSATGALYVSEPTNQLVRSQTATVAAPPTVPIVDLPYSISPSGIAYDAYGQIYGPYGTKNLFIADSVNNAIQVLNLDNNVTATFLSSLNGITNPVAVMVDTNESVYVLNQNSGANGYISAYDIYGNPLGTNLTGLNHPTDFTLDGYGNFYVAEQSGTIRYFGATVSNTLVTLTNANVSLQGIALFDDGSLAVSDATNQVIWSINAITKTVSRLTGQLGLSGTNFGSAAFAKLNQPRHLARAGNNQLIIADSGNNRLVTLARDGTITHALNPTNASVWFGQSGDPVANTSPQFIPMVQPSGVAVGNGLVYASETYYADIRGLNNTGVIPPASNPGVPLPVFAGPGGIVLNMLGTTLFIADATNNTLWSLNLNNNLTTAFLNSTNGLVAPVDVAVDSSDNLYVLNRGNGNNGFILEFDKNGNLLATNATSLSQATAMKYNYTGDIFVTEAAGTVKKFNAGNSNVVAVVNPNPNVQLQGVTFLDNGTLVVSDAGNHVLWKINPGATNAVFGSTNIALFAGLLGASGATLGDTSHAQFNKPLRLAGAYGGLMAIVDSGNNRVVLADDLGNVTTVLNSANATLWFGQPIDPVPTNSPYFVPMLSPVGVVIGNAGTVFVSENVYKDIRGISGTALQPLPPPPAAPVNVVANAPSPGQVNLTWQSSLGATNYNVKRSTATGGPYTTIGSTSSTAYSDASVINGTTYFYVIAAGGAGGVGLNSAEVNASVPQPPVPDPQIGYVDFPATSTPVQYTSVFHPVSSSGATFNNDLPIVILSSIGSQTFYNFGDTVVTNQPTNGIADPTPSSGSAPVGYQDGMYPAQVANYSIAHTLPDLTIRAIGEQTGHPNSSIVQTRFQFVTANPSISGGNAAQFYINDITDNCDLYYTVDGTDPGSTNAASTHLSPVANRTNSWTVGIQIQTNTLFKVRAERSNYQPSAIVSTVFSVSNFVANTISFGFGAGEASSDFVGSSGQTFYAPVTLSMLANTKVYSLQFNLTVTNAGPNPGPAINPGTYSFTPRLMKPIPGVTPVIYEPIPPAMFNWNNLFNPYPIRLDGSTNFSSLLFTNNSLNLLGVGWIERAGATNLYDTLSQDLIMYSIAHDTLFQEAGGKIIVGGYAFQIPLTAANNQTYQIQISRPSATSDGIGAPDSDVYIASPTNGSTAGGTPISAFKFVTVGQRKYIAGSVYPFRWFNAGDFGSSNIVNADVEQVFEAAVYGLNSAARQAPGSDFFDAMDSCGSLGVLDQDLLDPNFGNYTNAQSALTSPQLNALFDGDDTSINQIAFGDGNLDVCDVYVTFRRSLDPSLTWYRRFWNNGQRVADTGAANVAAHVVARATAKLTTAQPKTVLSNTVPPQVNFTAGDILGSAGQTVQIPITATVLGKYPLRVLMLNLSVTPLDGSPALTAPVQFTQNATVLGTPFTTSSQGNGNYAGAWLNSANAGLTGTNTIGTLSIPIPNGATSNSAYAVHFEHASASPNGIASFPKQTVTGLITLSSRTNSSYGDAIPDTWRLRWFGTANNLLSVSNACPAGDGVNNWMKFVAGVDPTVASNFPSLTLKSPIPSGYRNAIHWPTVSGKKYVIERSASLYSGTWTTINTNTGTGSDMEFDDNTGGAQQFYRVRILP